MEYRGLSLCSLSVFSAEGAIVWGVESNSLSFESQLARDSWVNNLTLSPNSHHFFGGGGEGQTVCWSVGSKR